MCNWRSLLRLENKLSVSTTSNFLWHVLRLPMEFFGQRSPGEIVARIEINDRIAQLLSGDLAVNIANLVTAGLYAFLMFLYDPVLTLIGIGIAALNLAVLRFVSAAGPTPTAVFCRIAASSGERPWPAS